MQVNHTDSLHS